MRQDPWEGALCREHDPRMWFQDQGAGHILIQREAQAICRACPLQSACLEYALLHNIEFGVWGGLTAHDRKRLRRRRVA